MSKKFACIEKGEAKGAITAASDGTIAPAESVFTAMCSSASGQRGGAFWGPAACLTVTDAHCSQCVVFHVSEGCPFQVPGTCKVTAPARTGLSEV